MQRNSSSVFCFHLSSYVAPEYASTGMLNERSDVYSFGVLIMEIITGRNPVDYSRSPGEVGHYSLVLNITSFDDIYLITSFNI